MNPFTEESIMSPYNKLEEIKNKLDTKTKADITFLSKIWSVSFEEAMLMLLNSLQDEDFKKVTSALN
jgi:predicted transcriptional regulator